MQDLPRKCVIVVCVFYRPPASSIETLQILNNFMYERNFSVSNFICMGDFNAPGIHWPSLTCDGRESNICKELIDFTVSFGLTQIVHGATRLNAVLDLVFLSSDLSDKGFDYEIIDGLSDHQAVLVSLACVINKPRYVFTSFPDFERADDLSVLDALADAYDDFVLLSASGDIDTLTTTFENLVKSCISEFIPTKTKKKNTDVPWMTRDLLHLSRKVRRLRRCKSSSNPESIIRFTEAKRKLREQQNIAKDFFFRVQLQSLLSDNPRKFWRSVLPRDASCNSFKVNDRIIDDPAEISNNFNSFFQTVFTVDNLVVPSFSTLNSTSPISDVVITEEGVLNLVLMDPMVSPTCFSFATPFGPLNTLQ